MDKTTLIRRIKKFSKPLSNINIFNCYFIGDREIKLFESFDVNLTVYYNFDGNEKKVTKTIKDKSFNKLINLLSIINMCETIYKTINIDNPNSYYSLYIFKKLELECSPNHLDKLINGMLLSSINERFTNLNEGSKYFMNLLFYYMFDDFDINIIIDHNTHKLTKLNKILDDHILNQYELEKLFILLDVLQQRMRCLNCLRISLSADLFSYPYHENSDVNATLEFIFNDFNNQLNIIDRDLIFINKITNIFDLIVLITTLYTSFNYYYETKSIDFIVDNKFNYNILQNNRNMNILLYLFLYIILRIYSLLI